MNRNLIFFLACLSASAHAFDPATIQPNQVYSSTGMINIRTEPPKTIFYLLGDKKGLVKQNDEVTVKDIKEVNTLINKHYWLNIERINPETNVLLEQGWIYGGKAGSQALLEPVE